MPDKEYYHEKFEQIDVWLRLLRYKVPIDFNTNQDSIPVSGKVIGYGEISNMVSASLDGWLTTSD